MGRGRLSRDGRRHGCRVGGEASRKHKAPWWEFWGAGLGEPWDTAARGQDNDLEKMTATPLHLSVRGGLFPREG